MLFWGSIIQSTAATHIHTEPGLRPVQSAQPRAGSESQAPQGVRQALFFCCQLPTASRNLMLGNTVHATLRVNQGKLLGWDPGPSGQFSAHCPMQMGELHTKRACDERHLRLYSSLCQTIGESHLTLPRPQTHLGPGCGWHSPPQL